VRKLVASTYVTLDGVFENPGWSAPYWSNAAQHFARDLLWASDAMLVGRKTYEGFAAAWPTDEWIEREGEFAVSMNSLPKYVASRSLSKPLEWSNSHLLEGDVGDAVRKLKEEPGQNILMYSSVALMNALMEQDLVYRFLIWVHPLVLGKGERMFAEGSEAELELADTTVLPNGVAVLDYELAS
jgi:dihydrofolate reductase